MPFRFHCSHCHQRLSVTSRKRGQEVKCPRCHRVLRVPGKIADEEGPAEKALCDPADASFPAVAPQGVLVYAAADDADKPRHSDARRTVTVPRYVLYSQGFLLGTVALVFFVFGLIVGSRSGTAPGGNGPSQPAIVTGSVSCKSERGSTVADVGSVVILLPASRRPDEKAATPGLRPQDPELEEDHPALAMLHSLGGDYARADHKGRFQLRATRLGRYYLLVISKGQQRSEDESPASSELAQLGRFFVPATDLLGRQKYHWQELVLRGNQQVEVAF